MNALALARPERRRSARIFAGVAALALCGTVLVAPGAADAAQAPAQQAQLEKVGEARLKVLLWSIYHSTLYTADGDYSNGERPLRLEIEYFIDIPADRLVDRTEKEWDAIGRQHSQQDAWLKRLRTLWPDIQEGDVLAVHLAEDDSATFTHNGEVLGTLEHPDFGQHFVDIWLSPESTRPEMRLALLGRDE